MRRFTSTVGLAIAAFGSAAVAQSNPPSFTPEIGLELGLASYAQAGQSVLLAPVALRYGFYSIERQWEAQLRVAYSDHRSAPQGRQVRLGADIQVIRRPTVFPMGAYFFGGASWTMIGPRLDTRMSPVPAVSLGAGRRILLGARATFRPEIAVQHSFPGSDVRAAFGAENEVQIRFGL